MNFLNKIHYLSRVQALSISFYVSTSGNIQVKFDEEWLALIMIKSFAASS